MLAFVCLSTGSEQMAALRSAVTPARSRRPAGPHRASPRSHAANRQSPRSSEGPHAAQGTVDHGGNATLTCKKPVPPGPTPDAGRRSKGA